MFCDEHGTVDYCPGCVADDIKKDGKKELILFAKWWMKQGFLTCIVENEVDDYLRLKGKGKL